MERPVDDRWSPLRIPKNNFCVPWCILLENTRLRSCNHNAPSGFFFLRAIHVSSCFISLSMRTTDGRPNRTTDGRPNRTTDGRPNRTTDGRPNRTTDGRPYRSPNRTTDGRPYRSPNRTTDGRPYHGKQGGSPPSVRSSGILSSFGRSRPCRNGSKARCPRHRGPPDPTDSAPWCRRCWQGPPP